MVAANQSPNLAFRQQRPSFNESPEPCLVSEFGENGMAWHKSGERFYIDVDRRKKSASLPSGVFGGRFRQAPLRRLWPLSASGAFGGRFRQVSLAVICARCFWLSSKQAVISRLSCGELRVMALLEQPRITACKVTRLNSFSTYPCLLFREQQSGPSPRARRSLSCCSRRGAFIEAAVPSSLLFGFQT